MDTFDHEPPPPIGAPHGPTARLHAHLHDILDPPRDTRERPDPVDVRDYLLDPPPTDAELERRDRRRRQVRLASIIAAGVIAVVLLVPIPRGGDDDRATKVAAAAPQSQATAPTTDADTAPRADPEGAAEPRLPRRIDVPARAPDRGRRTRHTPSTPRAGPADRTPERSVADPVAAPAPAPATPAATSTAPAPPAPAPPVPTPAPSAGALVPVL